MPEQVHGHEVMQMMMDEQKPYTRETLREAMVAKFGAETRYFTCSAEGMTPDELIELYKLPDNMFRLRVRRNSPLVGKTIENSGIRQNFRMAGNKFLKPGTGFTSVPQGRRKEVRYAVSGNRP